MRRNEIFWGGMLVALGILFFLRTAGFLEGDIFSWFWPLLVMAAGAWILLEGYKVRGHSGATSDFAIPLQGARQATLTVNHGMSRLELRAGASDQNLLTGNSAAGLTHSARLMGDRLEINIDAGPSVFPFIGPEGGRWNLSLNPTVPTRVILRGGASQLDVDLAELQVTRLDYDGGASSMKLSLPARVDRFESHISTGAASFEFQVPDGVAARFSLAGPGTPTIDQARFAAVGPGVYQSSDFETATRRAVINIDGGATSIRID